MLRPHARICLAAFALDFAVMIAITVTPFFVLKQLGGTAQTTGLFGAVQAIAYAGTALVSANFVARVRNGLWWALGGITAFTLLYAPAPFYSDWRVCLVLTSIANASLALAWPALHSWVGAEPNLARRARTMAWFNISWSFGFSISPLVAGPLYDANFYYPFVALAVVAGISVILIYTLPAESAHFDEPTEELLLSRAAHDRASELFLLTGWFATFIANAMSGAVRSVYPKRIDDLIAANQLRLLFESSPAQFLASAPATNYSFLAFSFSFATAMTFLALGRTTWWRHRFLLLAIQQVLAAGAMHVLGRTHSLIVMCLCCAVIGSFLGLAFFSATYYSIANPVKKHGRAAINEAAVGFGGFFGSLTCGFLAQRYGVSLTFRYAPIVVLAAIGAQYVLLTHARRATQ